MTCTGKGLAHVNSPQTLHSVTIGDAAELDSFSSHQSIRNVQAYAVLSHTTVIVVDLFIACIKASAVFFSCASLVLWNHFVASKFGEVELHESAF